MDKLMTNIARVAQKEFRGFFATPAAYLFLGAFLAVTLFVFFWVETFFARNIADVRPLFQWLPLLLIFLVAALTIRAWSEERRAGTLESLLTAPVSRGGSYVRVQIPMELRQDLKSKLTTSIDLL